MTRTTVNDTGLGLQWREIATSGHNYSQLRTLQYRWKDYRLLLYTYAPAPELGGAAGMRWREYRGGGFAFSALNESGYSWGVLGALTRKVTVGEPPITEPDAVIIQKDDRTILVQLTASNVPDPGTAKPLIANTAA